MGGGDICGIEQAKTAKMKQVLVILGFLIVGAGYVTGQNVEVRLFSGIGISTSDLDSKTDWLDKENHLYLIPTGFDANFFFFPKKRLSLFLGTGLEYSKDSYYQKIKNLEYGYNLSTVTFSQQHLGAPLRIGAELKIFNTNSIGLQYEFQYNFAMKEEVYIEPRGSFSVNNGSLRYKYFLTSRTWDFRSRELSLFLKTQIGKNLFVLSSLYLELREPSGDYDFRTDQRRIKTDITTGEQYQEEASYLLQEIVIEHNMVGIKVGLTKCF
jgi:hypothetical protein